MSVLPVIGLSALKHNASFIGATLEPRDAQLVDWWVVAVALSTAFSLCWDVFMDWGLGSAYHPEAPFLRYPLLLGSPYVRHMLAVMDAF